MNPFQQCKADYLRGVGYYETPAGWTHSDHGGKCFTLEAAYEYELPNLLIEAQRLMAEDR